MASKREEYKLAMAENLIVDVLREGNEEKYIDKVRDCLSELQDCYSFKEDDLYHPRISKKAELRESYESLRKASLREHVDYYVMLGDEPKYSTEEQNAADLLGTVTFNRIINGTSKREFYLMAKYVVLTDGLMEESSSPYFMNHKEKSKLYKMEDEISDIVEELNTSGRDYLGERLEEHNFDDADDEKVQEYFEKMGGKVTYYPGTYYSPPEYEYDETQYESAAMFQIIDEQKEFISSNRYLIEKEMERMGADIKKSADYVNAIELLDDKIFLEEGIIDRERAEKICKREKNNEFPMKERLPYLEILITVDDVYDKMKGMSLYRDRTLLFASDENKINTILDEIVKNPKNDMKLYIKDNVFYADWKYDYNSRRQVSIPFDGTLHGFIESCENSDKRAKCYYWKYDKGNFLNNIISNAKDVEKCNEFIDTVVLNVYTMASSYMANGGNKFVPSLADTMKRLSNCQVEDAVSGRDKEWNKETNAKLNSYISVLKDGMERIGRKKNDTLWYRPVAAKRVLKAYKVMSDVLTKEIKVEQGVGKELKK